MNARINPLPGKIKNIGYIPIDLTHDPGLRPGQMPKAEISVREFVTAHDRSSRIKQYAATQLDPDYKTYPHLFRDYRSADKTVIVKQAGNVSQCEAKPNEPQAHALITDSEEIRYRAVSGVFKVIPKTTLKLAGWKKIAGIVHQSQPQEFIDTVTGEILTNRDIFMRSLDVGIGYSVSERYLESLVTFNNCTEKELPFIRFILCNRNRRGGLIMGISDLIDIWLFIEGIEVRAKDLARKRRSMISLLKKRKIMANGSTLAPHFQLRAKVSRRDAVHEKTELARTVDPRPKPGCSLEDRYRHLFPESASIPRWSDAEREVLQQWAAIERGIWAGCCKS
jgi:hypothetical protein